MTTTWLKDLVFSSKLLEKDALTVLRYLLGKSLPAEKYEIFLPLLLKLEDEKITKEDFLEEVTALMGYREFGSIVLELYHLMEAKSHFKKSRQ
ncbi:hypothetical protein MPTK1_7g14330 [Marchantia polymorpha subsp. ruderalis]|uniref:Uncharacterized protein n=2 Tax=Marchantia polymorpha TaxID=3197 RepID=A0AAF6BZI1_MARPO|nr:hypothetical protein MARPO_0009s0118 [Marchantia polymorpha]BBN17415.1 hypothetical protein Mp_7g14330 [Marchantia polymorpha subsp. ruderalis]|eukprot:PTQ47019.1 hypothetical protein MARPO_0009s0118 [Marchantia polymorpha]